MKEPEYACRILQSMTVLRQKNRTDLPKLCLLCTIIIMF